MSKINSENRFSLIFFLVIALAVSLTHFLSSPVPTHQISRGFYLLLFLSGIWILRRTLLLMFSDTVTAITLVMIVFSTNIFYVTACGIQWQAILSFSLYSLLLFSTISWHKSGKLFFLILLACGIAFLNIVSSTGYISLLFPVLWGVYSKATWKEKITLFRNKKRDLVIFLLTLTTILLLLIPIGKLAPGEIPFLDIRLPGLFLVGSRYLWDGLLSPGHGLLLYTPVIIFPLVGFYFLAENKLYAFYAVFVFCIAELLVQSSWSDLAETDVFGQIAFVPMMAMLSVPLASFIEKVFSMKWWWKTLVCILALILMFTAIFQSIEYNKSGQIKSTLSVSQCP